MKVWTLLPPKWAHDLSPFFLPALSHLYGQAEIPQWQSLQWQGLHFKNRLGLAGGVDKNGLLLDSWWRLGCGFVEVGTVTPQPQAANPGKIMDRNLKLQALWNKMGFPSQGAEQVLKNLSRYTEPKTPILVNVGKNRQTENKDAVQDYLRAMGTLQTKADAFVINISSPNTKGLRELQKPEDLKRFLNPLVEYSLQLKKPILLKLSPDMLPDIYAETLLVAAESKVNGFVLTNTTLERSPNMNFPQEGGVSGLPLKQKSLHALQLALKTLGPLRKDMLIVSCGGVMSSDDVAERLHLGADLVEIYSALVLQGPDFFKKAAQCLKP